jgi:sugar phosphate isomerase/epimerase
MQLGVVSSAISGQPLDDALAHLRDIGITHLELACAGFFTDGAPEGGLETILACTPNRRRDLLGRVEEAGLTISALALHGQPLSPDAETAAAYLRQFRLGLELAQELGVARITLLAGLPAGAPGDTAPCWVANAFPPAYARVLEWQWEERLLPYWREQAARAAGYGCRLCFEMVPGDMIYNPAGLIRLRDALGDTVGCNFDPSHLFCQGIDPLEAIPVLGDAIYAVHAKDADIIAPVARVNGLFDSRPPADVAARSWRYRTVGYGHDEAFWRAFMSVLRTVGYDGVVAIEHEDDLMAFREGLEKASELLRRVLIRTEPTARWWA